ncbi:SusC/RagA family TonB-linked outer membrane protein [Puteibacter caeruleilacunae]|nr:SusC/RagA family TonB-linked outer membrane protein [Puteibacter caeruleilacunae]
MKTSIYSRIFFALLCCCGLGVVSVSAQQSEVDSLLAKLDNKKVNVAYGIQKQEAITGAVETINADKIENNSFTNTHHTTLGRFAGMVVQQSGGEPGSNGCNFIIRGKRTYNNSTPLIVIDGFEGDFSQLSLHEIESITVLKDAVATAIYGMRGGNGVILVTTKQGEAGKTKFDVTAETGILQPTELPDFVDAYTYANMLNEAHLNDGLPLVYNQEQLQGYAADNDPYVYPNVDWVDEMLKSNAIYYNANIGATGGDQKFKYYIGLNYMHSGGLFEHTDWDKDHDSNTKFSRVNLRSNVSIRLNEKTDVKVGIAGRLEDRNDPEAGVGSIMSNIYASPANRYVMLTPDGKFGGSNHYRNNPLGQIAGRAYNDNHFRSFQSQLALTHQLDSWMKGLYARGDISFKTSTSISEKFKKSFQVFERKNRLAEDGSEEVYYQAYGKENPLVYGSRSGSQNQDFVFRVGLGLDRTLGEDHLSAVAFFQQDEYIKANTAEPFLYQAFSGRLTYDMKGKYFGEFTASYNGNNAYNPDDQFGFFPALGIGWLVSQEDFMTDSKYISYLKLRGSYGLVGNDNGVTRFGYLADYVGGGSFYYSKAPTKISALTDSRLPNMEASWEQAYQANLGIDMTLFNNLEVTLDLFSEKRTDILQSYDSQVTDMLGVPVPEFNYGEVTTNGIELLANYKKAYDSGFAFAVDLNLGYRKTKIDKLFQNDRPLNDKKGDRVGQQYGYVFDGFYSASDVNSGAKNMLDAVQAGDVRYKDISGPNGVADNVIDDYDRKAIGYSSVPEINYGIDLSVSYKGFYCSALFDGRARKSVMMNDHIVYRPLKGGFDNISTYAAANYWTEGREASAALPRLTAMTNNNNYQASTLYQKDGGFVRLRTAEVGYNLPETMIRKIGLVRSAKVFVRGHNMFSIDDLEVDPEVKSGYPQLKMMNLGINVQF